MGVLLVVHNYSPPLIPTVLPLSNLIICRCNVKLILEKRSCNNWKSIVTLTAIDFVPLCQHLFWHRVQRFLLMVNTNSLELTLDSTNSLELTLSNTNSLQLTLGSTNSHFWVIPVLF